MLRADDVVVHAAGLAAPGQRALEVVEQLIVAADPARDVVDPGAVGELAAAEIREAGIKADRRGGEQVELPAQGVTTSAPSKCSAITGDLCAGSAQSSRALATRPSGRIATASIPAAASGSATVAPVSRLTSTEPSAAPLTRSRPSLAKATVVTDAP
jgi:hypothetical protein